MVKALKTMTEAAISTSRKYAANLRPRVAKEG
jgi:hypothetical protein